MREGKKIIAARAPTVHQMTESIVGCKWSLTVIDLIRRGIHRPGRMEHAVPGLSAKVLNERLRKLQRFGIVEKRVYPEVPPRTEYTLTDFGRRFVTILDAIEALQEEWDRQRRGGATGEMGERTHRTSVT